MNAMDVEDNRTGVVRHFKQKNQKGAIEIAAAIDEAKESQALSLEDFRLRDLPDEVYEDLPDLGLLAMGWNLMVTLDARIARFSDLKVLDLTHNYVNVLPAEITQLTNLKVL